MFDEKFLGQLEYAITDALTKSKDIDWRRCWCDGVLLPDNNADYSSGQISKTKEIELKAWIDEGRIKGEQRGQFLYDMRLGFGEKSIDKLKTGDRLEDCIPNEGADEWIVLDREHRIINAKLN
jgi:hypothetical protein